MEWLDCCWCCKSESINVALFGTIRKWSQPRDKARSYYDGKQTHSPGRTIESRVVRRGAWKWTMKKQLWDSLRGSTNVTECSLVFPTYFSPEETDFPNFICVRTGKVESVMLFHVTEFKPPPCKYITSHQMHMFSSAVGKGPRNIANANDYWSCIKCYACIRGRCYCDLLELL